MDINEILARLDAGSTADEIAAEMTEALNQAQKIIVEREEKSKREKEKKEEELDSLALDMLLAFKRYMSAAYPDRDWDAIDEVSADEIRKEFDNFGPLMDMFDNVKIRVIKKPASTSSKHIKSAKPTKCAEPADTDSVIYNFLKTMGLL